MMIRRSPLLSRLAQALVALALCLEPSFGSSSLAADVAPTGGSFLFTACRDAASDVTPLAARPLAARRTLASPLPHRPRAVAHRPHRKVRHVRPRPKHTLVHKAVAHRPRVARHRHTVAHRPVAHHGRPVYRKVTYASPLCIDRAPVINALLDDLGIPQFQPVAAPVVPLGNAPIRTAQVLPSAPVPGGTSQPHNPGFPVTNCCDIGTPTPPPVVSVPEPATWVLLLMGFGGLGLAIRRRRRRARKAA